MTALRLTARVLGHVVQLLLLMTVIGVIGLLVAQHGLDWRVEAVLSGSMEPTLATGGVVVVEPVDPDVVAVDDVITWRTGDGDEQITHRVIAITADGRFQTRGDNNGAPDLALVDPTTVQGRMVGGIPLLGYAATWMKTPGAPLIVAGVLLLLAALSALSGGASGTKAIAGNRRSPVAPLPLPPSVRPPTMVCVPPPPSDHRAHQHRSTACLA